MAGYLRHTVAGLATGVAAGVFGGLSGVGGTVVMVPLLTGWLQLTQHEAHGTSLVGVLATGLSAAIRYAMGHNVSWPLAISISVAAILSARAGALAARRLSGVELRRAFGWFMFAVAAWLWMRSRLYAVTPHPVSQQAWMLGPLIGLFSGFLAGFFGIGGGIVIIPAMVWAGFPQHVAQGTSLAAIFPSAVSGVATHHRLRHVRWAAAPGLAAGSLLGGYLGASIAHRLDDASLRLVMASAVATMGLIYSGLWARLRRRLVTAG